MPEAANTASEFAFASNILQIACYELMLPSVRGALHRHALAALRAQGAAADEEVARHALWGQQDASADETAQLMDLRRRSLAGAAGSCFSKYENTRGLQFLDELLLCEGLGAAERIKVMCQQADITYRCGRIDEAVAKADQALAAARSVGDELEIARAQLTCGRCSVDSKQNARVLEFITPAADVFRRLGNPELLQMALVTQSSATWLAGRPNEALAPAEEAAAMAERLGNTSRMVGARLNVINILAQVGRIDEALEKARAMEPYLDLGNNPETRASVAATLGVIHHYAGQYDDARRFYERASREAAQGGLQAEVARAEVNLGGLALEQRRYNAGLSHLESAEGLARELGDHRVLWYALNNRFEILASIGDFRSALYASTSAARVAAQAGLAWQLLSAQSNAATAFLELGQADDALQSTDDALRAPRSGRHLDFILAKLHAQRACALFRLAREEDARSSVKLMEEQLARAKGEPAEDSLRWIHEARAQAVS